MGLSECKSLCQGTFGCNAILYSLRRRKCVLLDCPLPHPTPTGNQRGFVGHKYLSDLNADLEWLATSKIWNNDECDFLGEVQQVTTPEECKAQCRTTEDCTAVDYSPTELGGDCVFRKCGIPVPPPQWDYPNYNGYYLSDMEWLATNRIWNDDECQFLEAPTSLTPGECKERCRSTPDCTAVNYSPTINAGDCILRGCSIPVPIPQWKNPDYSGYYLSGVACPDQGFEFVGYDIIPG